MNVRVPVDTDRPRAFALRWWVTVGALLANVFAAQADPLEASGSTAFRMKPTAEAAAALVGKKMRANTLERAVWTQDRELTHALLRAGADPNAPSSGVRQPLIVVAAMQGDPQIIDSLISHGANVNAASETGSPLFWAARQGNLEAVRTLLAGGADVKFTGSDGGTVWHATLGDGNDVRIAELLLDQGADLEARKSGMTPLMEAAMFGRVDWVRLFLQRQARVNARTPSGQTPLALSRTFGRDPVMERLLLEAGAH